MPRARGKGRLPAGIEGVELIGGTDLRVRPRKDHRGVDLILDDNQEGLNNENPKSFITPCMGTSLQLARAVEQGAKSVAGVEVMLRRVAEFAWFDDCFPARVCTRARGRAVFDGDFFRVVFLCCGKLTEVISPRGR